MAKHAWVKSFPGSITVCDPEGIILELNDKALEVFEEDGGVALIGTNLLDCHPEPSRTQLEGMLATQTAYIYTTERNGLKKQIYQAPWYEGGKYAGFVEISLELPAEMPHFVRG